VNLGATVAATPSPNQTDRVRAAGVGFFWLSAFYVVYCARPEDWFGPLGVVPLAKITGIGAFLAFLFAGGKGKRKFGELPIESYYLLALIAILMVSSVFSPVWVGGAITRTTDFSKVWVVWVLTFLLVTDLAKFRKIVYIQAASVPVVSILSIVKGRHAIRLEGVLGGIYSNPNDLAFAIALSLPFCLMFFLTARSGFRKVLWVAGMLIMLAALFMTASRGGFITLVFTAAVCLWHFGVRGKRYFLIVAAGFAVLLVLTVAGKTMTHRFLTLWAERNELNTREEKRAYDSFEQRQFLIDRAIEGIKEYPILGIGTRNFETYSTVWREVHMTYLQIAVEGGIPALILFLLFFFRGFRNLRKLLKRKDLSPEVRLFAGALHSVLVGFAVGALFSPEAYQFFPFFAVAYTSALFAYVKENDRAVAAEAKRLRQVSAGRYVAVGRVPVHT
jgi:O-antigen ligase